MSDYFIVIYVPFMFLFGIPLSMLIYNLSDLIFLKVLRLRKEYNRDFPSVPFSVKLKKLFRRNNI